MRILKHPIKKLTILTVFGGGYVLGARAGRERYEQIMRAVNQVKDDPRVPDTIHPLLADEHVADEDEVVYSTGPDIEGTVDELRATDDSERL